MASRSLKKKLRKKEKRTIAIIGLGQIGGSLVLAIRKNKVPFRIIGIETSKTRLQKLSSKLDEAFTRWDQRKKADLVVLCLHYRETIGFLSRASEEQLILDTCSSKNLILSMANKRKLRFIGGHPLAGNEHRGEKGWDPDLFRGAPFFVCPGKNSSKSDRNFAIRLIRKLGAVPILVNPEEHDRNLSITSHFPAFLSGMLADTSRHTRTHFQGPGFRSMTRLSKTSPELLATFLDSNRRNILNAAKSLRSKLDLWIKSHERT